MERTEQVEELGQAAEYEKAPEDTLVNYQLVRDRERGVPWYNPMYTSFLKLLFIALIAAQDVPRTEPESYKKLLLLKTKLGGINPLKKNWSHYKRTKLGRLCLDMKPAS